MKKSSFRKSARWLSMLLAVMMIFTVCSVQVLAEGETGADANSAENAAMAENAAVEAAADLPEPPPSFYIYDEEEVLSASTKNAVLTRNGTLYEKYGIQIVLMTMKEIPGANINAKGDYLYKIINSWQIGGISEKCLVLAMSVNQQDYVAVAGDGLSTEFSVDTWSSLFEEYLEPKFAAGEYDAGAMEIFTAMADKAELYAAAHNMNASDATPAPSAEPEEEKAAEKEDSEPGFFGKLFRVIGLILFIVLVILIIGFIVIYVHGQMVLKKRREARRRRAMQARAQQEERAQSGEDDIWNRY